MKAALGAFGTLPPNLKGAVFVVLGTIFFVLTDVTVKFTGDNIHPAQMALFRYVIGFMLMIPLFVRTGRERLKTKRIKLHFFRAIIASCGQAGLYYAVIHLLLADATAIIFTRPLFLTLLAIVILKEVVGLHRWGATVIGFMGVLVMVRPFGGDVNIAWGVAITAVFLFSWGLIIIRLLGREEPPGTILFWYHIFGSLIFLGPAIYVWVDPTPLEYLQLFLIAALTAAGMNFFVRGFAIGESSLMGPMEYIRIVFAAMAGYFIFSELPDIWTWVGAAIIVSSTLYITRREAKLGKPPQAGG
ncbi:MAG: DMT family transporter [Alphaproteobacteria bacterium]